MAEISTIARPYAAARAVRRVARVALRHADAVPALVPGTLLDREALRLVQGDREDLRVPRPGGA